MGTIKPSKRVRNINEQFNQNPFGFLKEEDILNKQIFWNDQRVIAQSVFQQHIKSYDQRMRQMETEINLLKTTRPRIEESNNTKEILFEELRKSIENLSLNFKDMGLRLNNFIDLKNVLSNLNKEARKWDNVYLLRSIVVFYDSIKHAYAEELTKKQCDVIKQVGDVITNESIDRNRFREIYRKLLNTGFQIIPEPKINE